MRLVALASAALLLAAAALTVVAFAAEAAGRPGDLPRDPGAADPAPVHPELAPTFAQFGGREGLVELMDDFMLRLLADPRTRPFFEPVDQQRVKQQLVDQFCAILGGGCAYTGNDMKTSHAQLGLTRADFNALVELLQDSMDARGVPFRAQNRLLAVLAPMHREVVTQ